MPELSLLTLVGATGAAVLVVGWLAVSFLRPGLTRSRVAWLAATGMYLAFVAFFASLFLRARGADSLAGTVAFGFLLAMFASGFVLSVIQTVASFRSGSARESHATH